MADIPLITEDDNMQKSDTKKKKGSKRNKKKWRKNADIQDVEEHLEDIRKQERTGGIVSDKPNEELYFIEKEVEGKTIKETKAKNSAKDPESTSEEEDELVSRNEKRKRRKRLAKNEQRKQLLKMRKTSNIWNCKEENDKYDSWIQCTIPKKPKKPNSIGEKPFSAKAVEVCHPGASYNPNYEDHQNLLSDALKEEVKSLKRKEALDKKMKFLTKDEIDTQPKWLDEMGEGLFEKKDEKPNESLTKDYDEEVVLSRVVNADDRKGRRLRTKERQLKQKAKLKQEVKTNKIRMNDVYRLRSLKREMQEKEAELRRKHERKIELNLKRKSKPQRLGKLKYEDSKLDFQLSEELSGSLRGLKSEGDLLKERVKSLQKRCLIEPRKRVIPHRKYKEKFVEKRSYKKPTVKDFTSKFS